ncbi:hypothetical protein [Oxalicibacterium faecigallinarum]|uniref:Uncharacterized protein n=1 Tax=Oxalicibacterium faecigallinarum TaxID=573741 RepID=A0A8J3AWZ4_9BURK|nr:hypothetical protein [Oxalicibacterium faecigallinarum]GGI18146.1 hypothetical protein GCM10008066_12540 [Oxalicibacterium faecigallinarum]
MNPLNVQFNVNVLTVPSFIQPSEFSTWLHQEARALQDLADDNSLIIVRLYLAQRIKAEWSRKDLDALLQGITAKYPHIFRVEMIVIEEDLKLSEIEMLQSDGDKEIASLMESMERYQNEQIARSKLH